MPSLVASLVPSLVATIMPYGWCDNRTVFTDLIHVNVNVNVVMLVDENNRSLMSSFSSPVFICPFTITLFVSGDWFRTTHSEMRLCLQSKV